MCFGNLPPIASRTSTSDLRTRSLAAANPARSGTVSRSQTMTVGFIWIDYNMRPRFLGPALRASAFRLTTSGITGQRAQEPPRQAVGETGGDVVGADDAERRAGRSDQRRA